MSIVWCVVWGISVLAVMAITIKYYLPKLSVRALQSTSEVLESASDEEIIGENDTVDNESADQSERSRGKIGFFSENKRLSIVVLLVCMCFSMYCGFNAANNSQSLLGMIKMTIAFVTLSCVFVTDLELMIIPNLCSIILIVARLITIGCEFIWFSDNALAWLINSIIALVISLIALLVISKITRQGIGMGDVKLYSSLAFLCGIRAGFFTLLIAFLICAIISTLALITKKKKLKDLLPLGPFIWVGFGISILLSII